MGTLARTILSVDVEDWFHILDLPTAPDFGDWERMPSRVERNFRRLLDLFCEAGAHGTCFFLGWVAERYPHLVREAASAGHEIASHGYAHRLIYSMSRQEFRQDALRSKSLLEDISGQVVQGFRAPGFSVTPGVPWFFDELQNTGYRYDSSIFPARRQHGGWVGAARVAQVVPGTGLVEFPVTVVQFGGRPWCLFGGGYLRAFPAWLVARGAEKVLREGRPVIIYVHPREVDPEQPRLPMRLTRRLKSYVNLATTEPKLKYLLGQFEVKTFRDFLTADFGLVPGDSTVAALSGREEH